MSIIMHSSFNQYQPISVGHNNSIIDQLPVPQVYSIQHPIPVTDTQYNTILYPSVNLDNVNTNIKSDTGMKVVPNFYNTPNSIDTNKFYNQPVDKIVLPPINTIIRENDCNIREEATPGVIEGQVKQINNTAVPVNDTYPKQGIISTNNNVAKNIPAEISPQIQHVKLGSPIKQFPHTLSNSTTHIDSHNPNVNKFIPMQPNIIPYSVPNNIRNSIAPMPQLQTPNLPVPSSQPILQQQEQQRQLQQQLQLQPVIPLEQNHQSQIYQPYYIYVPMMPTKYQIQQQPTVAVNNGCILNPPNGISSSLQQQYITNEVPVTVYPIENYSVVNPNVYPSSITVDAPKNNANINKDNMEKNNLNNKIVKNKKNAGIKFRDNCVLNGDVKINNDPLNGVPSLDTIQTNLNIAKRLRKQCPVCGKICSRPSTLKTHYLIHSGDTPFKCTWEGCTKAFNVKSNMMRHLKSHQKKARKGATRN